MGDDLLSAQGNGRGLFRRKSESLIHRIGVQTLGSTENRRQSLKGHSRDIVFRLLRGQRWSRPSACESEASTPERIVGAKALLHPPGPHSSRGAKLGHFFKEIVVAVEKEAQAPTKFSRRSKPRSTAACT